uniref:Uncharacterized protein n=1 Tax=Steinernema glaseri TaxID=37863 RepID=A0A1I7ZW08_9BILA
MDRVGWSAVRLLLYKKPGKTSANKSRAGHRSIDLRCFPFRFEKLVGPATRYGKCTAGETVAVGSVARRVQRGHRSWKTIFRSRQRTDRCPEKRPSWRGSCDGADRRDPQKAA